ncbi:hypothetical protein [Parolsenella catena]|uniref:hypothetical protein n=1 Tax=Parolsenella catena TaxID=2003188 RepID=UPI003A94DADD
MSTRKNCPVTFAPNEDLDGSMCETEESVKGRICRLFGFTSEHLSMQEGFLESAKIAGTRYFAYTSVHFTANGIGWSTDFENLVRDPVLDER